VTFEGENKPHKDLVDGLWQCDCDFFQTPAVQPYDGSRNDFDGMLQRRYRELGSGIIIKDGLRGGPSSFILASVKPISLVVVDSVTIRRFCRWLIVTEEL
jgi:hypothetical protein